MKKLKTNYTKFNHWLNYSPPGALTSRGWRLFKNEFRERAPIRFWLTNSGYNKFILPVKRKYNSIISWLRYRTVARYHILDTGLPPRYYSADTQMMHVNFNILKNFVEVELAWHTYVWSDEAEKNRPLRRKIFSRGFFKNWFTPTFRGREWAIKYFEWASTLDDKALPPNLRNDHQAKTAREIRDLYLWWVDSVPNRKLHEYPEFSDQGLGDLGILDEDFDHEMEDYKKHEECRKLNDKLSEQWEREDEEMLVRLVKIRKELWT